VSVVLLTPADPLDRLAVALARIAAQAARATAEIEAVAADSRAAIARLQVIEHVNPLAHLIGAWNV
jgi:hypothetical protein